MKSKFSFYKTINESNRIGFILPNGEKYFYDKYGGWLDNNIWYNNDGVELGKIDENGTFQPNWSEKIGEIYKAGPLVIERINKSLRLIDGRRNPNEAQFLIKIFGMPQSYSVQDYIKHLVFEVNLKNGTILDCKKCYTGSMKEYFCQIIVMGQESARNCVYLEGQIMNRIENGQMVSYRMHVVIYLENVNEYQTQKELQPFKKIQHENRNTRSFLIHFANIPSNLENLQIIQKLVEYSGIEFKEFNKIVRSNNNNERGFIELSSHVAQKKLEKMDIIIDGRQVVLRI